MLDSFVHGDACSDISMHVNPLGDLDKKGVAPQVNQFQVIKIVLDQNTGQTECL
jgi:hypothetical protein